MEMEKGDLSDFDVNCITKALASRQSKVVASCALSIKLLLAEIQKQLLVLMVDGRLTDTTCAQASEESFDTRDGDEDHDDDGDDDDDDDDAGYYNVVDALMAQVHTPVGNESPKGELSISQDAVVTGATVPITGPFIKSPNPYPCPDCDLVFPTKKELSRHIVKHEQSANTGDTVDSAADNAAGINVPDGEDRIQAGESEKDKDSAVDWGSAVKIKSPLSKSPAGRTRSSLSGLKVTCEKCGTQTLKQHMARHMMTHSGIKPYECNQCGAAFSRKDKLKEHIKKHEDGLNTTMKGEKRVASKIKLNKCRKCDFETKDKQLFKEHRKTHPAKSVYKCADCDKEYHCPSHLEQHRIKHRNDKPFMCDMCGVSFSREPNLARHIRSHTSPAPYQCKHCGKPYHRNNELIVHERNHTGEKPYICEKCGNGYASSKYLKRHLFTHTGLKPFKCDLCERAFARPENMRAHRKLHEKISNRLPPPTTDAVASAFHAGQISSVLEENVSKDISAPPAQTAANMYQFADSINLPPSISVDSAATAGTSNAQPIMQSFKL